MFYPCPFNSLVVCTIIDFTKYTKQVISDIFETRLGDPILWWFLKVRIMTLIGHRPVQRRHVRISVVSRTCRLGLDGWDVVLVWGWPLPTTVTCIRRVGTTVMVPGVLGPTSRRCQCLVPEPPLPTDLRVHDSWSLDLVHRLLDRSPPPFRRPTSQISWFWGSGLCTR